MAPQGSSVPVIKKKRGNGITAEESTMAWNARRTIGHYLHVD